MIGGDQARTVFIVAELGDALAERRPTRMSSWPAACCQAMLT